SIKWMRYHVYFAQFNTGQRIRYSAVISVLK
ncbi:MAG: hypothetical protein ACJA2O_003396, partial [Candidatus Azotimanducaceae bacterium]